MPAARGCIDEDDVLRFAESCFAARAGLIGAEIEFLAFPADDPLGYVDMPAVRALTDAPLPGGSRVTFEPGGQIELSSAPFASPEDLVSALEQSLRALEDRLPGVRLLGAGVDAMRPERRLLFAPRYDAMEAFFDCDGLSGRIMMCRTAAIQVNVDLGPDPVATWKRAHALGPVMAAAFANSPLWCGAPSGWASTRLATWFGIDPTRTAAVGGSGPADWARYMLDARVMLIRRSEYDFVPMLQPFTLRSWIANGHELGWPTMSDVEYHATTLFPPIRPRGWLELRMCDALPDPWWKVPVLVWPALLARDVNVGDASWHRAARAGLADPSLAADARACFEVALEMLAGDARAVVEAYADRYVYRGRTPADDVLDGGRTVELAWT